jgi:hypothetical protein
VSHKRSLKTSFISFYSMIFIHFNKSCFIILKVIQQRDQPVSHFRTFQTSLNFILSVIWIHITKTWLKHHCLIDCFKVNRINGLMVSVLASSVVDCGFVLASSLVDCGFEPRSGQTKNYEIGICCFAAKHAALRRKGKDWSAQNENNVSEWSDMSTRGLLFQWSSTIKN